MWQACPKEDVISWQAIYIWLLTITNFEDVLWLGPHNSPVVLLRQRELGIQNLHMQPRPPAKPPAMASASSGHFLWLERSSFHRRVALLLEEIAAQHVQILYARCDRLFDNK